MVPLIILITTTTTTIIITMVVHLWCWVQHHLDVMVQNCPYLDAGAPRYNDTEESVSSIKMKVLSHNKKNPLLSKKSKIFPKKIQHTICLWM